MTEVRMQISGYSCQAFRQPETTLKRGAATQPFSKPYANPADPLFSRLLIGCLVTHSNDLRDRRRPSYQVSARC